MGIQFSDVTKNSAGYYTPTHLCTVDNKCYTPNEANLPTDVGKFATEEYYRVNEALKYQPLG